MHTLPACNSGTGGSPEIKVEPREQPDRDDIMEIIKFNFSEQEIENIRCSLNILLKNTSIIALSYSEVEDVNSQIKVSGFCKGKYHDIIKTCNRWGIRDNDGQYYKFLNDVIGEITKRYFLLQIYKPIQLLLFNKLLEGYDKGEKILFTENEIETFFSQPYRMISSASVQMSSICLNELIIKSSQMLEIVKNKEAIEFLSEGVGRRLKMLKECTESISKIYCNSRIKALDNTENAIISENTNFFYANIYAIIDCLAFVLAFEEPSYKINRHNPNDLRQVGLFNKKFYSCFDSLDKKLNLIKLKYWYDEIIELRHPIAHRIPLYFPDFFTEEEAQEMREISIEYYKSFNKKIKEGEQFSNKDCKDINDCFEEVIEWYNSIDKISDERQQAELSTRTFSGCFLHSIGESKKLYHISRIVVDLGILYILVDDAFEYIKSW